MSAPRFPICLSTAASLALLLPAGCGGENPADFRASVRGSVTLDGEPLKEGRIKFVPAQGPIAGGNIIDGTYTIPLEKGVALGKNRVEINSTRKTDKKIKSAFTDEMIAATEEAIPEKYNKNSSLERDVQKGDNTLDFQLESNGGAKK